MKALIERIWLQWSLLVVFSVAASIAYFAHLAQGMVAGDLIGILGREADVLTAQHAASRWLWVFVLLQLCAGASMFTIITLGEDAARTARLAARTIAAVILSLFSTAIAGIVLAGILTFIHRLLR